MSLLTKIKNNNTINQFRYYSTNFSYEYALYNSSFFRRFGYRVSLWAFDRKIAYINKYIETVCDKIIQRYSTQPGELTPVNNFRIWVFWAQGFENAPYLVRMCNQNLHKQCSGEVVNLTMDNFSEWVEIPASIIEKVNIGTITLIHFSDILRLSLLAKYGGLWIDSTCLVTRDLSGIANKYDIYTCSREFTERSLYFPSDGRWAVWLLGTRYAGTTLFSLSRDILYEYAKTHDLLIDYFLIDFVINYVYKNYTLAQQFIDSAPISNPHCHKIKHIINDKFCEVDYNEITSSTFIHKLTYKKELLERTNKGEQTYYGKIKSEFLNK